LIDLHLKEYRDVAEITFSCPALSVPEFSGSWRHLEITNISSWWLPRQLCDECDRKDSWTWLVNDHNVKKPASRVLLLRYHLSYIMSERLFRDCHTRRIVFSTLHWVFLLYLHASSCKLRNVAETLWRYYKNLYSSTCDSKWQTGDRMYKEHNKSKKNKHHKTHILDYSWHKL